MTTVTWPGSLPDCAETWNESDAPSTIRSEMDAGPPKVRRRFTGIMRNIEVSMVLTNAQFTAMRTFYETTCAEGVNFHQFKHPYTGATETFRFVSSPRFSSNGPLALTCEMTWEQIPYA